MRTALPALLVAVVAGLTTPAAAGGDEALSRLTLALDHPDGPEREVVLTCEPSGGSHPEAEAACADLQTSLAAIVGRAPMAPGVVCTMEYDPRTVSAAGHWHRRLIRHTATYGNPCVLRASTGVVFEF
jgi:hypothetical protein